MDSWLIFQPFPMVIRRMTKEISLRALLVWHGLREVQARADRRFGFYRADAGEEPSKKSVAVTP